MSNLEIFRFCNERHWENMFLIFKTLWVLKLSKFIEVKVEQPENIYSILTTLEVSNGILFTKFFKEEQSWNIEAILVTWAV